MKSNILLVEDDKNLGDIITDYLELKNYKVHRAMNGIEGLQAYKQNIYDLLLLDVMLPLKDGFTLAKEIRTNDKHTPIIFLTARNESIDRIEGFKSGCDDYLAKPFSSEELELRIEAILRRCSINSIHHQKNDVIQIGNYSFDVANHELRLNNQIKKLTSKENNLLYILYLHKNQIITRQKVLLSIWGSDNYFLGRSMDVFITKLRKLLKDDPNVSIVNIHGTGFRLEVK